MTQIRILLALAASFLLLLNTGCENPSGTVDDDDTSVNDDDDATGDDDDDTGTVILSVDESLPTVQVVISRLDSEERTMTECETVCELREIPAGHYSGEAMLENGLFVPIEFDLDIDDVFEWTFAGGFAPNDDYGMYDDVECSIQTNQNTFSISTTIEGDHVDMATPGLGHVIVTGDTFDGGNGWHGTISSDLSVIHHISDDSSEVYFCRLETA